MRELWKLVQIMMSEKKPILLSILLGFLAAISSVGLLGTGGYLISKSALHPPLYTLTMTIVFVRFFGLARAASRYAERYVSHEATFSILGRIRVYFYDKIEPLAPALFANYRSGDLLSRVVADVERLQYFFLRVVYPPIVMVVVFITTGVILYAFSISMAIVLFVGFLIVGFGVPVVFSYFTKNIGSKLREKRSQLSVEMTEYIFGFVDLKSNLRLEAKKEEINAISDELIATQKKDGLVAGLGESVSLTIAYITAWIVLFVGVIFVQGDQLNGVYLAMLVLATLTVFESATPMAAVPGHIEESRVSATRLFELTKQRKDEPEENPPVYVHDKNKALQALPITISGITFSYPNDERKALKDVKLEIPAKKKIAIVGASGSGKSSLVNLMLKFYTDYTGDIYLGDKNLSKYTEEEAREYFGVVAQSNHFFNETVRSNLLLAKPHATDPELQTALHQVSLTSVSLDDKLSEKGLSLSGGERQRLAIARMILKDAPILLLDEPTTGLDSLTEKEVLSVLWPLVKEKSVLYITHRLVGLQQMDEIVVLNKGEIVEQGTYDDLLQQQGYFYQLKQLEREKIE